MARFSIVNDGVVILRSKGVYRQADLYERDGGLYARYGSGYIGLRRDGRTTVPNVSWDDMEGPEVDFDALGRMVARAV